MKLPYHVLISAVISGLVWLWLKSAAAALACFLTGFGVDLDHLFDYTLNFGRFRLRHFFRAFEYEVFDNIVLFLHAWEWIIVGLIILWLVGGPPVAIGIFIGFISHIVVDQIGNAHHPWAYFLTYRLWHRFSAKYFYGPRQYRFRRKRQRQQARTDIKFNVRGKGFPQC